MPGEDSPSFDTLEFEIFICCVFNPHIGRFGLVDTWSLNSVPLVHRVLLKVVELLHGTVTSFDLLLLLLPGSLVARRLPTVQSSFVCS